jgi:hypothetical protein
METDAIEEKKMKIFGTLVVDEEQNRRKEI